MKDYDAPICFDDFESLLNQYKSDLQNQVQSIYEQDVLAKFENSSFRWKKDVPCTVVSLFEQSCIEKGLSYTEGGTDYCVVSPHIGGLPDVANSLYAIKKAVFDDKIISFADFMPIDTVDKSVLTEAQKHPENFQNLSVRVSGWNARFVTMNKEWQDMIIERTK